MPTHAPSETRRVVERPVTSAEAAVLLPRVIDLALQWMRDGEDGGPVVLDHPPEELQKLLNVSFPDGLATSSSVNLQENGARSNGISNGTKAASDGIERVLDAAAKILQYSVNPHTNGRFASKLYSTTDATGVASELLLGVLNANAHVFSAAPALGVIEVATVRKINDLIGFGADSGGLTMPGGSASNRLSLTTAIHNLLPSVQQEGMASLPQQPVILTSDHSHYSVEQAAISAGIGLRNVRRVSTDAFGRMDIRDVRAQLEASIEAGQRPFYINATSGTTVTGCFDNIRQIAALAQQFSCWLHVDGSWGGSVLFSDRYRHLLDGIELAHSVTVNPHKGLRVPLQCSFLLIRDHKWLGANVVDGDYLFHEGQQYDIGRTTTFCGRRSDALKMYIAWQMHGSNGLARMIDDALDSGQQIRQRIREHPNLQLILPHDENVPAYSVCFRYCPSRPTQPTPAAPSSERLTPRQMVRPIHAEVSRRGRVMVDFAPIRIPVGALADRTSGGETAELDADAKGFVGEVFRLPLHPFGLDAGLLVLDEIVEVGNQLFNA
ncbi:hypothetical protein V8E36_002439 [Tilletia maclaganii]